MTRKQRISYVPPEKMTPEMRAEMERCAKMGTLIFLAVPVAFMLRAARAAQLESV